MKRGGVETVVGLFVLLGLVCVAYLTIKLGKMEWFSDDHYRISAEFASVTGLKQGAAVEIAGVQVGEVEKITLDDKTMAAAVVMTVRNGLELDDETIASVRTSGLIGDKFICLQPGGGTVMVKDGGHLTQTQSAVDMEELIGKYAFGKAK